MERYTEVKKEWFVIKEVRAWEHVQDLGLYCWVSVLHQQITPTRNSKDEANEDYLNLGFKPHPGGLHATEEITPGKLWVSYMVQCRTIFN